MWSSSIYAVVLSLCLRSSCSGVMHFIGEGTGASGELLPISLGLGSKVWIGGKTGAPVKLPDVIGRGEFFVGLIPDRCAPCELCGGEEWMPLGVAAENEGYLPRIEDERSWLAVFGRG